MLENFPRPPDDNGRGVHWSHSPTIWGKKDWGFWKEQIQALNLKWVKMMDTGDGSSIGLAKRLIDIGVMPVVRFYRFEPNPNHISTREINAAKEYIKWGVVYFETNNEPDLTLEWKNRHRPDNWLEIVVDNFIIEADMIRGLGGYLLFPAFGPGGRGNPFKMIVERGRKDILDGNCCLAIHNYCLGRPLDYPNDPVNLQGQPLTLQEWEARGGSWAWEMSHEAVNEQRRRLANPNASIMEDSTCFRAFEYFDALVNEAVGHSIPIFTTEGGYNVGQRAGTTAGDDPRYPKPTPEWAGRLTEDMFRYIQNDGPDYYFACMPWLIAVARIGNLAPPFENQGPWYTNQFDAQFKLNGELPIVPRLKALPSKVRATGPMVDSWTRYQDDPKLAGRNIDDRLKYLEPMPTLQTVAELGTQVPNQPYWKLSDVRWADQTEGGIGYIFVKAVDEKGSPIEGATFQVGRPDATETISTKGPADDYYGNALMTAELGVYNVSMKQGGLPSDRLINVGRGGEETPSAYDKTSFFLTFERVSGFMATERVLTMPAAFSGHGVAFTADGRHLAICGYKKLYLWDAVTGQKTADFSGHTNWVKAVAISPTADLIASASWDKTVRLWSLQSKAEVAVLEGHGSWVSSVAFSPDGKQLISSGADQTIRLWDVASRQEVARFMGHQFHVWAVTFSPDGQAVASASGDKTVRLWNTATQQEIRQFVGHQHGVLSVAFTPDGRTLASGSVDGTVRLWKVDSGEPLHQIEASGDAIYSVAFSPDGRLLASGHLDGKVYLWRVESGQKLRQLSGHADVVRMVAFSPAVAANGAVLASTSGDGQVRLWVI